MAYSYKKYTADGGTQTFTVTFPYISKDHVAVYVDNVEDTTFTWPTTATVTLSALPGNGAIVWIKRVTPKDDRLVDFIPGNTVSEDNLDIDSEQNFYSMQETLEAHENLIDLDITDDEFDANSKVIKNVADPSNDQDAATRVWCLTSFNAGAEAAQAAAEAAQAAAETAETNAGVSETNAGASESAAATSETNAGVSETNAAASEAAVAAAITTHKATANEYSKTQNFNKTTLTSGANVDWNLAENQVTILTLGHNVTMNAPTNIVDGATYVIVFLQDGTGNRTLSWNAAYNFEGDAPEINNIAGKYTIFMFVGIGSVLKGNVFFTEE